MNRRMSGGSRGPNRPFSQQAFQGGGGGGVNPWQGGGGPNQSGLISQLSSNPQLAALAISSLLQPQQQPPSLLSLNTSPAFGGQGRDFGRYGGSGGGGFNRGREARRHEPYNKNRGGGDRRRRSPNRNKKNNEKKNEKKDQKKATTEDGADDEKKDTKRDWKDEKNTAEGKDSGDEGETKDGEKKTDSKEGRYAGISSKYFNCFVCNKQMWDGESMGKHVRGRAHHEMLKALEESIHICVNILRENMRLAEERKLIEFNRQNRQRKFHRREPPMSHCAMCDLKFMGKIINHRRTDAHQRLKRYLHPTCRICDKEYPSRIEWVEHCLTPEHLKKLNDSLENKVGGKDGDEIIEEAEEDLNMETLLEENTSIEAEDVILEVDDSLENMSSRIPAYKRERAIATKSLTEFSGWRCSLCNRSFADKENADAHLKTRRHYHQFVESIKERYEREEKKKKAEKAAKDKAEKEEKEKAANAENGEVQAEGEEVEGEGGEDEEMYDPTEVTNEANGEEEEEVEKMDTEVKEETEAEPEPEVEPEPEIVPEPIKEEPKVVPATPKGGKKPAGPKSRRGGKK